MLRAENAYATANGPGTSMTPAYPGPLPPHRPPRSAPPWGRGDGGQAAPTASPTRAPRIRVMLASDAEHWPRVTDRLLRMTVGSDHFVGVVRGGQPGADPAGGQAG